MAGAACWCPPSGDVRALVRLRAHVWVASVASSAGLEWLLVGLVFTPMMSAFHRLVCVICKRGDEAR